MRCIMHLLPRDEKFFDLLVQQTRIAFDASRLIADGLGGAGQPDFRGTAQKVRDLERKGDEAARQICLRLHQTFITPIDPEDVHLLVTRIDEILDHFDAVAIARMVHACVEATVEAIETLEREGVKKPEELTKRCEEINRRELEAEDRVRAAVRNLFATERDPIALIKRKEIYELLETAADAAKT
jgi:uncharacterized protein